MKRRDFVVASVVAFGTVKAMASKAKEKIVGKATITPISANHSEMIYLKRGEIFQLPAEPAPIETLLQFNLSHYRFGTAPVLLLNGQRIDGRDLEKVNVVKDLYLKKVVQFNLQYTGPDVGWIVLS